jgi:hypothetical protein
VGREKEMRGRLKRDNFSILFFLVKKKSFEKLKRQLRQILAGKATQGKLAGTPTGMEGGEAKTRRAAEQQG